MVNVQLNNMETNEAFGEELRMLRAKLKISKSELARLSGISRVTITNVEKGEDTYMSTAFSLLSAMKSKLEIVKK